MGSDLLDRLKWHLRLGEPGPAERTAAAIASGELREADVDLPTWRRAQGGARDDVHARERYVRLRVATLRRELRAGSGPLLSADLDDRAQWADELERRAAAHRATPEGEEAYRDALGVALRGVWTFSLLYFGGALLVLVLLVALWWAAA